MSKNTEESNESMNAEADNTSSKANETASANDETTDKATEGNEENDELSEIDVMALKVKEAEDKYLRLYSDFENFRRRTAKERLELSAAAGATTIKEILPVMDDFERAIKSNAEATDVKALKEGIDLVFNKLKRTLEGQGLKEMKVIGDKFDPEIHEAVTRIPAPKKKLKGAVVDVVEKGYTLNDKVIRFPKVVIGE